MASAVRWGKGMASFISIAKLLARRFNPHSLISSHLISSHLISSHLQDEPSGPWLEEGSMGALESNLFIGSFMYLP